MHSPPSTYEVSGPEQQQQQHQQQHRHHHHTIPNCRTTITTRSTTVVAAGCGAITVVPLTDALLPLLEVVERACYPAHYCEGVSGYAKRLAAHPPCPSFVCLQRGCGDGGVRAVGYAIVCRLPRRCASLLVRGSRKTGDGAAADDDDNDDGGDLVENRRWGGSEEDRCPPTSRVPAALADTLYIHDVAVHPDLRGLGIAAALWRRIEETRAEHGVKRMALVAVFGANAYWSRHGFREVARKDLPAATVAVLEDYGDHAVFMERDD
ncbi:Acetyltransferase (GNAT) family [Novymonas esmeraldas]|uniref:Acetyltransferase (GNAT) family n=1 Tax=Novymonas esmeraldas TaxID=1808958 RepID=A0AAW0EX97_9TRYP